MNSGHVRIGIVGTGDTIGIGKSHSDAIRSDGRAKVTAVYNRTISRSENFIGSNRLDADACRSFEELLLKVDAVDICSPNETHIGYMVEAAKAGKPFITEKPLSASFPSCEKILEELERTPVFNMVGFVYRYSEQARALKRIAGEELGRIYTFTASAGGRRLADPGVALEWRMVKDMSGSGALGDFGSHLFDLALYTCGINPKIVSCRLHTFIDRRPPGIGGKTLVENDDCAVVCGEGENGEIFSVLTSRLGMDEIRICVAGEGGIVRVDFSRDTITFERKDPAGGYSAKAEMIGLPEVGRSVCFDREMNAFIDGILGKRADVCTVREAYLTERVLNRAVLSHSTGCAIEINERRLRDVQG